MTYPPSRPPNWSPPPESPLPPQPPQPSGWPASLEQPLPGPPPSTDVFTSGRGSGSGRLTLVLGALALVAVGLLTGLLVRGALGTHAAASTGAAARSGGGQALPRAGGGYGQGRAFPGGGNTTQGTISSLSSDGFEMTTATGNTVKVTIGPQTTVQITVTGSGSGALAVGQPVLVAGTESQGAIAATAVREGAVNRIGGRAGQPGGQPGGQAGGQGGGGTA